MTATAARVREISCTTDKPITLSTKLLAMAASTPMRGSNCNT